MGGTRSPEPIDDYLARQRARFRRLPLAELAGVLADGGILVDIRPIEFRAPEGEHPDALVIDRNVLEWRLDPASDTRVVDITADTTIVVMCNDGFASSLAAVGLIDMGFTNATDLIGGYRGWKASQDAPSA